MGISARPGRAQQSSGAARHRRVALVGREPAEENWEMRKEHVQRMKKGILGAGVAACGLLITGGG